MDNEHDDTQDLDLDVTVSASDARSTFSELLNRASYKSERIGIERHGKVVAVLVPTADLALLLELQEEADVREAERRKREESGERIGLGTLLERLGLNLEEEIRPETLGIRTAD